MSRSLGFLLTYVVNSVWEVPVIAFAGWLINVLLRKCGPKSAHIHWVVTLMLAVATPAVPFLARLFAVIFTPQRFVAHTSATIVAAPFHVRDVQRGLELPDSTIVFRGVLPCRAALLCSAPVLDLARYAGASWGGVSCGTHC